MSSSKTIYLIRHAESEENRRLGSLKSVFSSLGRFSLPKSSDLVSSLELANIPAQVDSKVSEKGLEQINSMAKILKDNSFADQVDLVVHSPLERAKDTCFGLFPEFQNTLELDLIIEKTPSEWMPGQYKYLRQRMDRFEEWLSQREEKSIAVVGHSQYFKAMLDLDYKFGNVDVWKVSFDPEEKWTELENLYSLSPSTESSSTTETTDS